MYLISSFWEVSHIIWQLLFEYTVLLLDVEIWYVIILFLCYRQCRIVTCMTIKIKIYDNPKEYSQLCFGDNCKKILRWVILKIWDNIYFRILNFLWRRG